MSDPERPLELAYASLAVFADDGTLDMEELSFLLGIALKDGVVTPAEKRVLANVFDRVDESSVSARVWLRIQAVRRRHGI